VLVLVLVLDRGYPRAMSSMACSGCGAALGLPPALTAQEVVCEFCSARTPIPADLLSVRLREHQALVAEQQQATAAAEVGKTVKRTFSFVMWIVIISTVGPIILTGVIMFVVAKATSNVVPHVPAHATHGH
jgi:hypothetical protein